MTMSNRAYSLLEIKEMDENTRTFSGIATTPTTDLVDDVVEPKGAQFKLPLPLLWQHRHHEPIGHVIEARVTDKGIFVKGKMPKVDEPGRLKDRLDEAWQTMKAGLVAGLSIGFQGVETAQIEGSYGTRFIKWLWLELSAVTIAANSEATITSIKSIDAQIRAASGNADEPADRSEKQFDTNAPAATGTIERPSKTLPGVSGKSTKPVSLKTPKEGNSMKTIAEQITALESKRAAGAARMEEIQQKTLDDGRTKDEAEKEEFGTLRDEIGQIDEELKDLRDLEKMKAAAAKPVAAGNAAEGSNARDALEPVKVKAYTKPEKGVEFARLAKVRALAFLSKGEHRASDIAKAYYGENSPVYGIVSKAAVVAGSSIAENWAADLVGDETGIFADFAEFLRPMTIVGKFGNGGVPSLRRVPFRTRLLGQTGGGQAYWVGEGKPKPLTAFDFTGTSLDELKVATITVVTEELLRKSSPSADMILRDALAGAVAEKVDQTFIDPAVAASAGVSPASITNGVVAVTSSGNDADAIREDLRALWSTFVAANNPPTSAVYIMSAGTALALSLLRNPLGQKEFDGISMMGGSFEGVPVIVSEYLAAVSAGGYVALVNASDIYFGDEGGVQIDVSREASLQMLDNPTNDSVTPTATSMVSMWQTNSVAFRAERILNWSKRRASAVAVLDEVNWGQPVA